jgi:hypothetical protein
MKKKQSKTNNLVAKHSRKFNRASVHVDRKKEVKKKGYPEDKLYPDNGF